MGASHLVKTKRMLTDELPTRPIPDSNPITSTDESIPGVVPDLLSVHRADLNVGVPLDELPRPFGRPLEGRAPGGVARTLAASS